MDISGKSAIVTGGASGLGNATAKMLAAAGAKVAILDMNTELAEKAAAEIGGIACITNVADDSSVKAAFEKAMAALKEKRESHKATQEREAAANADERHQQVLKARYAKRDANRAKLPPVAQYVTVKDLQDFKKEFFSMMPKEVYKEVPVPVERIVPHAVVKEVVREKIVEKPKVITGNELLDRLYFNK